MQNKELKISYSEVENESELSSEEFLLLQKARELALSAYAPYSNFFVGSAVLLENGVSVFGNNQENAAFPSGLCAERVAVFSAGANYPNVKIRMIAIVCKSKSFLVSEPLSPCGACRQALSEYEIKQNSKIRIILSGEKGKIRIINSVEDLLPFMFKAERLKVF